MEVASPQYLHSVALADSSAGCRDFRFLAAPQNAFEAEVAQQMVAHCGVSTMSGDKHYPHNNSSPHYVRCRSTKSTHGFCGLCCSAMLPS